MQVSHKTSAVFDEPNLIGAAGLVPLLALAESAGLHELLGQRLTVPSPNPVAKATSVIAGMLAGADSIDDLDLLRHAAGCARGPPESALPPRWARSCARSRSGTSRSWTRSTPGWPHWAGRRQPCWSLGTRWLLSTPLATPVITGSRLRRGNAASGKGAAELLTGALATARSAGISRRVLVRADSAYYRHDLIHAAIRAGAWFSVTARHDAKVSAGRRNRLHRVHVTGQEQAGHRPAGQRPQPATADDGQDQLFPTYRHHAFLTNSTLGAVDADDTHRDYAGQHGAHRCGRAGFEPA